MREMKKTVMAAGRKTPNKTKTCCYKPPAAVVLKWAQY